MEDNFNNKIKRLELENFTCFGKVAMDFSPGINVFIGENGTGKTHLLKVLYSLSSIIGEEYFDDIDADRKNIILTQRPTILTLKDFFKTPPSSLVRSYEYDQVGIMIEISGKNANFSFHPKTEINRDWEILHSMHNKEGWVSGRSLFIPVTELLSWFKGVIPAYENRESYLDETYYRLAKALNPYPLKGEALKKQLPLLEILEEATNIKIVRKGDDFSLFLGDSGKGYSPQMVATGINKIAQLIYLIMNGSLTKDTILFWDEPEANLNPKYILIVAKFLQTLANAGCQIFVATHDYLLPYELSLSKEYADVAEGKVPDMKFFALYKGENGTEVEEGETMPDLKHDAIMEGAGRHNDREDILFRKSLNREK